MLFDDVVEDFLLGTKRILVVMVDTRIDEHA